MKIYFLKFFLHLRNLYKICDTLNKKIRLRGEFFLKLKSAKSGITSMPKKPRVRTLMDGQHVKGTKRLLKYARQYFSLIFDHSQIKSARKIWF